jgi:hypothetical protein
MQSNSNGNCQQPEPIAQYSPDNVVFGPTGKRIKILYQMDGPDVIWLDLSTNA